MAWERFKRTDRADLIEYLSENEWGHVGFSAKLLAAKESSPPQTIYLRRNARHQERVSEALLYTREGLIIPAFATGNSPSRSDLGALLFDEKPRQKLNTVMGLRKQVEAVQRAIRSTPHASVIYHAMTLTAFLKKVSPCDGIVCRRAKPRDAGILYPLQKGYEIEEVLLDRATFNARACYLGLQRNLRHEVIVYAVKNGRVVAKAGTNARGFTYAQIGGVYTVKEIRNQGVGEYVLSVLLNGILKTRKGASLFVKKENEAAIQLYKKLGFDIIDEFKIAYYR